MHSRVRTTALNSESRNHQGGFTTISRLLRTPKANHCCGVTCVHAHQNFSISKIITCLPNWIRTLLHAHERLPGKLQDQHLLHPRNVREHYYANLNYAVHRDYSPCVRSLRLAARLLVVRIAPALLRLYRASGRTVSALDFSSVGRTSSRRASSHCVSWRNYSSSGLHRLYCTYAVHPGDFSSVDRTASRRASGHCVSQRDYLSSGLHRLYCVYVVHPGEPS
jgi:hypothetical protein